MSYILDALKKSEMQARQGELPSIHSSHVPSAPPRRPGWHYAVFGGGAMAMLLGIAWLFAIRPHQPTSHSAAQASVAKPSASSKAAQPTTVPATSPRPIAPPVGQSAPQSLVRTTVSPTAPPAAESAPTVAGQNVVSPETPTRTLATASPPPSPVQRTQATPPSPPAAEHVQAAATAAAAQDNIPLLGQLPLNVQQAMPSINISGHIYDKNPASRMVFINGQIAHEGDIVASGLQLLAIVPDGVVMSFRDNRFRIRLFGSPQASR